MSNVSLFQLGGRKKREKNLSEKLWGTVDTQKKRISRPPAGGGGSWERGWTVRESALIDEKKLKLASSECDYLDLL